MIKCSDYVFKYLKEAGVSTVFTLTGGGIMHLVDSMGRSGMEYVCCHHEQAAAIAAQAYGMYQEQLCVCLVTTGPGGTNALTGAAAAYMDSTPVIFLSGQVKTSDFACRRGVRQFGAQENDIVSMAAPVTKYAVLATKPQDVAYELEKSVYLATHGRKGPVWIDLPLDVQAAFLDEKKLRHFTQPCDLNDQPQRNRTALREDARKTLSLLAHAKRPVLLVGHGVAAAKAQEEVRRFARLCHIPVLATWRALDFMDTSDEGFFGSPGLQAPRYSNLILQHCDFLLVLGSRLDNMITAFNEGHFAFRAKKVIVDIDANEIQKLDMADVYPVVSDVADFMHELLEVSVQFLNQEPAFSADAAQWDFARWRKQCRQLKERFPILAEKQEKEGGVNLYQVTEEISSRCSTQDVIVISSTSRCNTAGHIAFSHKMGQKTISSMGMGSMGFAIPSAAGAYYASGGRRVVVIEGDGSLQLNIQELETIAAYGINAKIFVFNNQGYAAITSMQDRNFDGFYVGSNAQSGLFMPDLERIAYAYQIAYNRIESPDETAKKVREAMEYEGPFLCDITGSLWFDEIPKCISSVDAQTGQRVSAYLENPYPYLPANELDRITAELLESV